MRVDVLDDHSGHIDEDTDRQRQPAQRHNVDGLFGNPQCQYRPRQRQRNVDDDDQRAAPITQEQQHHQAGQQRTESALQRQPGDSAGDIGRLVEFIADLHIRRHDVLELRDVLLHQIDHRERGSVRALGDRDIDRAAAIHQRVTGDNVGGVPDLAYVP